MMIITLHRRYPIQDHWEIDPHPLGEIHMSDGCCRLIMDEIPLKNQIQKILSMPITYIGGLFSEGEDPFLKTVEPDSKDYKEALTSELRRFGIEAVESQLVQI